MATLAPGVLPFTAKDIMRPIRICPYQEEGRLLNGNTATICELAPGACPLQQIQPTTGGRSTALCGDPAGSWLFAEGVDGHGDVQISENTTFPELARLLMELDCEQMFVVNAAGRLVGLISVEDLLAKLAEPETEYQVSHAAFVPSAERGANASRERMSHDRSNSNEDESENGHDDWNDDVAPMYSGRTDDAQSAVAAR
jgi:hypothetical protein